MSGKYYKHLITTFGKSNRPPVESPTKSGEPTRDPKTLHYPVTIMGVMKCMVMEYRILERKLAVMQYLFSLASVSATHA